VADAGTLAEVFRRLQAGDAAGALKLARRLAMNEPANARAHLGAGIALRLLGRLDDARVSLERAVKLDGSDFGAAFELGVLQELRGDGAAAMGHYERAARLRPQFAPAHFALGLQKLRARDWDGAIAALDASLALDPAHAEALGSLGSAHVSRGDFGRAAAAFEAGLAVRPGDPQLSMLLAQVELLRGHRERGWDAYARRPHRRHYEMQFASQGAPYRVPEASALAGRLVTLVGEQGLGDNLFFLRYAPALRAHGARLAFVGDARLHPLLARTGLFEALHGDTAGHDASGSIPLLIGDLPRVAAGPGESGSAHFAPSLAIAPEPARLERWRAVLQAAGPRPWIGVTWRAGLGAEAAPGGLAKSAPVAPLFAALAPLAGTVAALQRGPRDDELRAAGEALGRPVHDFSRVNGDLDDALAVAALLDRHVAVSNTNVHLAAAAGRSADVLVPFPPEWRWGLAGESPWFPGFRTFRETVDGDWSAALAALRESAEGRCA
jgi:Flp pilus assembly protein TadD